MPSDILDDARRFLVNSLNGKNIIFDTKHPWKKSWEFVVLHSLRVESYTIKILALENPLPSEHEVLLFRLAAVLHDVAKLDNNANHACAGAEITERWLRDQLCPALNDDDILRIVDMIADHSNKAVPEPDFNRAVLKDADLLDEIGVMSIFMTSNWLEKQTPFFFYNLRQRLIDFELPFCDKTLTRLNTAGAKEILREKKTFLENFIVQLSGENQADRQIEQMLFELSKNGGETAIGQNW